MVKFSHALELKESLASILFGKMSTKHARMRSMTNFVNLPTRELAF